MSYFGICKTAQIGLLHFLGTDDSGVGTHGELDDSGQGSALTGNNLARERPPGLTLAFFVFTRSELRVDRERPRRQFPGEVFLEVLPGRGVSGPGLLPACSQPRNGLNLQSPVRVNLGELS